MSNENNSALRAEAVANGPQGRHLRPEFEACWHLKDLGVVSSLETFDSKAWDLAESKINAGARPPLVVVMDTPLDAGHPNLARNIDKALMRDFSVLYEGVFPTPSFDLSLQDFQKRLSLVKVLPDPVPNNLTEAEIKALPNSEWGKQHPEISGDILRDLKDASFAHPGGDPQEEPSLAAKRRNFAKYVPGAHGTAVAGIIASIPAEMPVQSAVAFGETIKPSETVGVQLAYAGINPFATIVPISLTAAPYPDMVLGALNYISGLKPDVIVVAAAWADGRDLAPQHDPDDPTWTLEQNEDDVDFSQDPVLQVDSDIWKEVTQKLKDLSKEATVVCAAGNVDSEQLVFPARLCAEDDNNIWAVTACDDVGEELSYSPPLNKNWRMIKTISTQLPRSDRGETVIDNFAYELAELRKEPSGYKTVTPRDLITLDPRGRQGYNPSSMPSLSGAEDEPLLEIGSLFSRFSGTSAATAVAGGLLSLAKMLHGDANPKCASNPDVLFDLEQAMAFYAGGSK